MGSSCRGDKPWDAEQEGKVEGDLETEAGVQAPRRSHLCFLFVCLTNTTVLAHTLGIRNRGGRRGLYPFPRAIIAKYRRPNALNNRNLFSHGSGG